MHHVSAPWWNKIGSNWPLEMLVETSPGFFRYPHGITELLYLLVTCPRLYSSTGSFLSHSLGMKQEAQREMENLPAQAQPPEPPIVEALQDYTHPWSLFSSTEHWEMRPRFLKWHFLTLDILVHGRATELQTCYMWPQQDYSDLKHTP